MTQENEGFSAPDWGYFSLWWRSLRWMKAQQLQQHIWAECFLEMSCWGLWKVLVCPCWDCVVQRLESVSVDLHMGGGCGGWNSYFSTMIKKNMLHFPKQTSEWFSTGWLVGVATGLNNWNMLILARNNSCLLVNTQMFANFPEGTEDWDIIYISIFFNYIKKTTPFTCKDFFTSCTNNKKPKPCDQITESMQLLLHV